MNFLLDSSSVINLHNADALGLVARLERCRFWLPPMVVGECQVGSAAALLELQATDAIGFLDDDMVPTEVFLELLERHDLGNGETECIAICQINGHGLCCDDRKARELARALFGPDRAIGTIRVLRWCVEEGLIDCQGAHALFRGMVGAGGFLPPIDRSFFCSGDE